MEKNAKIYVAGHTGLVGSALVRKLKSEGYTNLITRNHGELDLTRQQDVNEFFKLVHPKYVFLAAARVGGIVANDSYPADFIYINLQIAVNVIHAAWRYNVARLLFLGSSCIYPRNCPQPIKEEYLLSSKLEKTNEAYALAKITGIKMCQAYNQQHGTQYVAVMPTNLYGPRDNFNLQTSHVLPALLRKMHLAKLAAMGDWPEILKDQDRYGKIPDETICDLVAICRHQGHGIPQNLSLEKKDLSAIKGRFAITLWGTGMPRREFLHVDDLADGCLNLMSLDSDPYQELLAGSDGPFVNIGYGKDITIKELAEIVRKIVEFRGEIFFDSTKPDGTPQKLLDVTRMRQFGWTALISLKEGVQQSYQSYLQE